MLIFPGKWAFTSSFSGSGISFRQLGCCAFGRALTHWLGSTDDARLYVIAVEFWSGCCRCWEKGIPLFFSPFAFSFADWLRGHIMRVVGFCNVFEVRKWIWNKCGVNASKWKDLLLFSFQEKNFDLAMEEAREDFWLQFSCGFDYNKRGQIWVCLHAIRGDSLILLSRHDFSNQSNVSSFNMDVFREKLRRPADRKLLSAG